MRYVLRRGAHALFVLASVSVLSFVFMTLAPGDFLNEMKLDPRISPETTAALRARYGLDRPLPERYAQWLRSVLHGDLGYSFAYGSPVTSLLWPRARNTLLLTVTATVIAWAIALPVGVWSAAHRGRWGDRVTGAACTVLLVIPELVLGLALLAFAVKTGYFPVGGMVSPRAAAFEPWDRAKDVAWHLVLPATALILVTLPVLVRHVRASVVDTLAAPFVLAARARGVPTRRLLFRDVLKPAANPLVSLLGLSIAGLLSTSLVIEAIMSWPGLGPLLLDAIASRDIYVVIGAILCSTVLLLAGNVLADGLLLLTDPRLRSDGV